MADKGSGAQQYEVREAFSHTFEQAAGGRQAGERVFFTRRNQQDVSKLPQGDLDRLLKEGRIRKASGGANQGQVLSRTAAGIAGASTAGGVQVGSTTPLAEREALEDSGGTEGRGSLPVEEPEPHAGTRRAGKKR